MQIKHRYTNEVLFENDSDNMRDCLAAAIEGSVNLGYANFSRANLSDANLSGANLSGADLSRADLIRADLSDANLSGADLSRADLNRADLNSCTGNRSEIKSIFTFKTYPITYTDKVMQIGCERHELSEWWDFDDARIVKMDGKKALKFWRESKDIIKQIIELFPATKSKSEV